MSTSSSSVPDPPDGGQRENPRLAASLFHAALGSATSPGEMESGELPTLPRRFGAFELIEEVGRGGMGVVYRARQTALDRIVAVKLLIAGPYASEAALRRFQLEGKAAAIQQHPGIVTVHDCGEYEGQPFIAMDLIPGRNLAEVCAGQALEARRAARIMVSLATAVQHAHEQGYLHRDLKPSNVLLDKHDAPHITDFGLAGRIDGSNPVTLAGQMLGSPSYTSPEQAAGAHKLISANSDVYGLGALFYHLLTGRAPFNGSSPTDTLRLVLESEPLSPRLLNPALPHELATICLKCLAKEPAHRYASAADVADDLTRFLTDQPIRAQPPSRVDRLRKLIRRHRLAFGAATAIALVLAMGTMVSTRQAIRATRAEQEESRLRKNEAALRRLSEDQTLAVRRQSYASDLNLIQQALAKDNLVRAQELLNRHRPKPGEQDLRGWEWRYLWQFCRSDPAIRLNDQPLLARQLAVSPDGEWLATACYDDATVELWNLRTHEHYPVPLPPGVPCVAIAFSPTQPLLAVHYPLGRDVLPGPAKLMLWNYAIRQTAGEWIIEHRGPRRGSLVFCSDGMRLLVAVGIDPAIWSVPDGRLLQSLQKGDDDRMVISPDFGRAAIEGRDGSVHLWDLTNGSQHRINRVANEYVAAYAFSPDGRILATAGGGVETSIRLWDPVTGNPLGTLEGHHQTVSKLIFWPDGQTMASGAFDQTIRIWDVATRRVKHTLRGLPAPLTDLVLLPDGKTLASATADRAVRLWDTTLARRIRPHLQIPGPVLTWHFTPDSRSLLSVDATGKVRRWHGSEFQECEELALTGLSPVAFGRWNPPLPQGAFISSNPPLGVTLTHERNVQVWNWERKSVEQTIATSQLTAVAVVGLTHRNRKLLVNWIDAKTQSRGLSEWDLPTGEMTRSWDYVHPGPANFPQSLISPDGRFCLVSWCENPFWDSSKNWGPVELIDLESGRTRRLDDTVFWWWKSAAFSADSRLLAIPRFSTVILEAPSFQRIKTLAGAACASFSPDGTRLALVIPDGGAPVRLLDTTSWETVLSLDAPQGFLFASSFSPDGNVLTMWSQFNKLVLWRAPTWAEIETAEHPAGNR